jgi:hypothetical protein
MQPIFFPVVALLALVRTLVVALRRLRERDWHYA